MWTMEKEFITLPEFPKKMGISRSLAYRWVEQEKVPHLKVNSAIRIPVDEIDDWIEDHMRRPLPVP